MTTHSSGGRVTRPFLFWALCVGLSVLGDALGQSALSVLAFEEGGGAALASVLTWPLLADLALPIVLGWVSDLLPAAVTAAAGNAALSLTWLAVSAVHPSALVGALQMLESGLNRLTVGPAIRLANALAGGPVTGRAASLSASLAWTGLAV
ncbi:hypothetical protein, partial [Deinococcus pimensis]|uniref:hypothetical protein n=1 Tax=Deinococcus pimensis TaxID=309888 RepID=UPI0005EB372E